MKIGGYFKSDFIHDLKSPRNTDAFVPSSFPVPQVPGVYNPTVSIRLTRLNLDFRIPIQRWETYDSMESDFFGMISTTPRLRHAIRPSRELPLVGKAFTNFMDPDAFPETLNFQGPNGMVSLRNPQFRYGFALTPSSFQKM